jgi:hypothetical protein
MIDLACRVVCVLLLIALLAMVLADVARAQFVTGDEEKMLRAMIPLAEFRADPSVLIYTERTMPKTYQLEAFNSGRTSVHNVNHNISADPGEAAKGHGRGGNIRTDKPWRTTAGTDNCPTVRTFKFLRLPAGKPIVWFRERFKEPNGFNGGKITSYATGPIGYAWRFPVGAIVGEVLLQRSPEGYDVPFEVRTRERLENTWTVDLFRPFRNPEELATAIKQSSPEWEKDTKLAGLVQHLETPKALPSRRTADLNHTVQVAFDSTASFDELPAMNEDLAMALLVATPFKSALGEVWRNRTCFAPTTKARFHVVPTNYEGSFVGSDETSCKHCHDSSGKSVRAFEFRDWYGFQNSGDDIISFHPFKRECIIDDASDGPVLIHNIPGVIEPYDSAKHEGQYHALVR